MICRGAMKLELRSPPQRLHGVSINPDPDPNWSFDSLLSELNSLELNLRSTTPFTKSQPLREISSRNVVELERRSPSPLAFVMRVSDYDDDDGDEGDDDEVEEEEEEEEDKCDPGSALSKAVVSQFGFDDPGLSDDDTSDHDSDLPVQPYLMGGTELVESAVYELGHEHQIGVKEEIRSQISALETDLISANEKSASAFARIEKYKETRREFDKKFDIQYQRKIAEALDTHLTAIQRDHEIISQMEERRIRNDAAHEEAKRKEKALREEKIRQERARVEAEEKRKAEEAERAAMEAQKKAAKEAAEREAAEASKKAAAIASQNEAAMHKVNDSSCGLKPQFQENGFNGVKKPQSAGDVERAAESALNLEKGRMQKLINLYKENQKLILSSNMNFSVHERTIARLIKQTRGLKENVRSKASELLKIFSNPSCPQSISIAAFAKKVVSHCVSPDNAPFACAHVIVIVTSRIPHAMDFILAEFHRACIYTVPKHIAYSKSKFSSKEVYYKAIGYQEDDGKIESTSEYLKRLGSYMRLYGALVQTEVPGVHNIHGPKEGWAWLARFLNALPANIYSATALNAFLHMAGYVLFMKYKLQFKKMLNIISNDFLKALRGKNNPELNPIIAMIDSYVTENKFLQEPEGRILQDTLLSKEMVEGF